MKTIPWIATVVLVVGLLIGWRQMVGLDAKLEAVTAAYAADRAAWADTVQAFDTRLAKLRVDSGAAYRALSASRGRLEAARTRAEAAEERLMAITNGGASDSGNLAGEGRLADIAAVVEGRRACEATLRDAEHALQGCEARAATEHARAEAALAQIGKREATIDELKGLAKSNPLRDFWRARALTLPLLGAVVLLLAVQ